MKTGFSARTFVNLVLAVLLATPALGACATATAKPDSAPKTEAAAKSDASAKCDDCGTIEAIVQRPVGIGANGYFVYDIHVRLDKNGLLKTITQPTQGALDKGERVHVTVSNDIVPIN
jgi:hypothetical protein